MDILARIIAFLIYAGVILSAVGLVILIAKFFYYRWWRCNKVKLYYDDNDHRKGYYYVRRPRGPYPVGYPREQIVKDMEDFERLVQEQKAKAKAKTWTGAKSETKAQATRPTWWDVLMMTPKEYMEYRRRRREGKN